MHACKVANPELVVHVTTKVYKQKEKSVNVEEFEELHALAKNTQPKIPPHVATLSGP